MTDLVLDHLMLKPEREAYLFQKVVEELAKDNSKLKDMLIKFEIDKHFEEYITSEEFSQRLKQQMADNGLSGGVEGAVSSLVMQSWSPLDENESKKKLKLTKMKSPGAGSSWKVESQATENRLTLPSGAIRVEESSSLLQNNEASIGPKLKDELVQHQPSLSSIGISQTGEVSLKSGQKTEAKTEGQPYKLGPETTSELPRISFTQPSSWQLQHPERSSIEVVRNKHVYLPPIQQPLFDV